MKNQFICILGIDGSGKSTLAIRLINCLNKKEEKYRYVWGGCKHYITYPLILLGKKLFLKDSDQLKNYNEYHEKIKKNADNPIISKTYHILILIDYFFQILYRIRIPLFFSKGIVTDRYVFGTMIDIAVNLGYDEKKLKNSISNFFSYCPKPDHIFFIDLSEEIAYARKIDIPSIDYLKLRRDRYLSIVDDFDIIKLNGLKTPDELEKIVMNIINRA